VSLLESDRRAERDRDEQKRLERKAAREQAGDKDEHKDEPKPDSGLDPGEQPITDNRDSTTTPRASRPAAHRDRARAVRCDRRCSRAIARWPRA
jgi:hypothetical protein